MGTPDPIPIAGLPGQVAEAGQGGLHDVAPHPEFSRNRLVYFAYAGKGDGGYGTELARGRLDGHPAHRRGGPVPGAAEIARRTPLRRTHRVRRRRTRLPHPRGSRRTARAPRISPITPGSIIRLTEDGGVPADNPYVSAEGARPEIFTLGNRNVQGAAMNPWTASSGPTSTGPQGGDEVNVIRAGANYGWPIVTYGRNYGLGTRSAKASTRRA